MQIYISDKKIKKLLKVLIRYVLFLNTKNYLVFKNDDGLFLGLYTFNLVDHEKVESFLKTKHELKIY